MYSVIPLIIEACVEQNHDKIIELCTDNEVDFSDILWDVCGRKNTGVLDTLIECGAPISVSFAMACGQFNVLMIKYIIRTYRDEADLDVNYALRCARLNSDLNLMNYLINEDLGKIDWELLMIDSVSMKQTDIMKFLIDCDTENDVIFHWKEILEEAYLTKHDETIKMVIKRATKVEVIDFFEITSPYVLGNVELLKYLQLNGVNVPLKEIEKQKIS